MSSPLEIFTNDKVLIYVGGNKLVGEYQAHPMQEQFLVEERIKILVRSMIKDLQRYHNTGYCVSKFSHHNFQITDSGRARLMNVTAENKTDELVTENYANLRQIITKTIFRRFSLQQHVPSDWRSLLGLMILPDGKEYLICNHSALMPIETRFLFFMKSYEHVRFSLGRRNLKVQAAIYSFLPYARSWFDLLKGNLLLEASFGHKTHDTSGNPEGFFDFYPHTNAHRMDRCHLIAAVGGYSAEDFEKVLVVRYPMYLFGSFGGSTAQAWATAVLSSAYLVLISLARFCCDYQYVQHHRTKIRMSPTCCSLSKLLSLSSEIHHGFSLYFFLYGWILFKVVRQRYEAIRTNTFS